MVLPRRKSIKILGLGFSVGTNNQTLEAEAIVVKTFAELDDLGEKRIRYFADDRHESTLLFHVPQLFQNPIVLDPLLFDFNP